MILTRAASGSVSSPEVFEYWFKGDKVSNGKFRIKGLFRKLRKKKFKSVGTTSLPCATGLFEATPGNPR